MLSMLLAGERALVCWRAPVVIGLRIVWIVTVPMARSVGKLARNGRSCHCALRLEHEWTGLAVGHDRCSARCRSVARTRRHNRRMPSVSGRKSRCAAVMHRLNLLRRLRWICGSRLYVARMAGFGHLTVRSRPVAMRRVQPLCVRNRVWEGGVLRHMRHGRSTVRKRSKVRRWGRRTRSPVLGLHAVSHAMHRWSLGVHIADMFPWSLPVRMRLLKSVVRRWNSNTV